MYHVMYVSSPMLSICVLMWLKMKRFMPVYTVRRIVGPMWLDPSTQFIHSIHSFDLTFIHSFPRRFIRRTRGGSMVVRLKISILFTACYDRGESLLTFWNKFDLSRLSRIKHLKHDLIKPKLFHYKSNTLYSKHRALSKKLVVRNHSFGQEKNGLKMWKWPLVYVYLLWSE